MWFHRLDTQYLSQLPVSSHSGKNIAFKLQYVTMLEWVPKKVEKFPVDYFITKRTFIYICF